MRKLMCLFGLTIALGAPPAEAVLKSNELRDACLDVEGVHATNPKPEQWVNNSYCIGFILGVVNGILVREHFAVPELTPVYCAPDNVEMRVLAALYVRWVEVHPKEASLAAAGAVYRMLVASYPCSK